MSRRPTPSRLPRPARRHTWDRRTPPNPASPPPPPPPVLAQITDVSVDTFSGGLVVTFDRAVACTLPGQSELATPVGTYAASVNLADNVIRFDPQCGSGDSSGQPWSWSFGAELLTPPADPAQSGTVD